MKQKIKYYYYSTGLKRLYRQTTSVFQGLLWLIGIAWHNGVTDDCTPDFNCCNDIGRWSWLKFPQKRK